MRITLILIAASLLFASPVSAQSEKKKEKPTLTVRWEVPGDGELNSKTVAKACKEVRRKLKRRNPAVTVVNAAGDTASCAAGKEPPKLSDKDSTVDEFGIWTNCEHQGQTMRCLLQAHPQWNYEQTARGSYTFSWAYGADVTDRSTGARPRDFQRHKSGQKRIEWTDQYGSWTACTRTVMHRNREKDLVLDCLLYAHPQWSYTVQPDGSYVFTPRPEWTVPDRRTVVSLHSQRSERREKRRAERIATARSLRDAERALVECVDLTLRLGGARSRHEVLEIACAEQSLLAEELRARSAVW